MQIRGVRIEDALLADAAGACGLAEATPSYVIRYALALMAGHSDPAATANRPRGGARTRRT